MHQKFSGALNIDVPDYFFLFPPPCLGITSSRKTIESTRYLESIVFDSKGEGN